MIKISYDLPNSLDYIKLRVNSGMGNKKSIERVDIALKNSLFTISLYDEKKLIGMGRIIGDGGISYAVTDIMVDKEYQGKGYGSEGLRLLEKEFPTITQWDLCTVLQDEGMVAFYEKNGYHQTHIEPEKEGMDMVYMKKLIEK